MASGILVPGARELPVSLQPVMRPWKYLKLEGNHFPAKNRSRSRSDLNIIDPLFSSLLCIRRILIVERNPSSEQDRKKGIALFETLALQEFTLCES